MTRCEVAIGNRDEHVVCREPSHWRVSDDGLSDYAVCERHAIDAIRYTHAEVSSEYGDAMRLDGDGEIQVSP